MCFPLAGLECFCYFSLAGCSDWLALGKGDIMFSPKPTCIPHPPSTAATIESLCVCVRKKARERECQREVCAFRRSHTLLFLLKCFSSPWRRLMRYDITALCFIFKRWAGSPSLPLNEAEVPTEYMEGVRVQYVCIHARSHPCFSLFLCMQAMRIGVGVLLVFCTFSLTPILPVTPGISCPEAMCQTSLATASITLHSLSSQHHVRLASHHVPPIWPLISFFSFLQPRWLGLIRVLFTHLPQVLIHEGTALHCSAHVENFSNELRLKCYSLSWISQYLWKYVLKNTWGRPSVVKTLSVMSTVNETSFIFLSFFMHIKMIIM